ncbi:MAG TPA: recombinase family protein [Alphaproteobacteria bacterium]|nr:recombinase family protein [Alphaproteobacteria bacterium]
MAQQRIVIYYRVSTEKQDIEHQRNSVFEWLERQKISLEEIESIVEFEDLAISGGVDDRPGFNKLLAAIPTLSKCKRGEMSTPARVVLFEDSRISRNIITLQNFYAFCKKHNTVIDIVGKGIQQFDTAIDQFMVAVQGFTAQAEREAASTRIKSGIKNAKLKGRIGHRFAKGHKHNDGKRKIYDKEIEQRIITLRSKGLGYRFISETIGIPASTVFRIHKRSSF